MREPTWPDGRLDDWYPPVYALPRRRRLLCLEDALGGAGNIQKFLSNLLANGEMEVQEIMDLAKKTGHQKWAVKQARRELGVISTQTGPNTWVWSFPEVPR